MFRFAKREPLFAWIILAWLSYVLFAVLVKMFFVTAPAWYSWVMAWIFIGLLVMSIVSAALDWRAAAKRAR